MAVLIQNQPQNYESPDGTLLALVLLSLMHEVSEPEVQSDFMSAVDELNNLPRLPIEVPEYAMTLDRGVDHVDAYCEGIVDTANDNRPDRPPLGTVHTLPPAIFLDEVRRAHAGESDRPQVGTSVEQSAITLAGELGAVHRADDQS
ncbi:hypothetical protein ACQBAR_07160 [Propionibacteriaceae bacterium Y1685]